MALPYSHSKADPVGAQVRIRKMLMKFGVDRIIFDEDFNKAEICVKFKYKDYPVSMPINYGSLSRLYIKEDPWTARRRCSQSEWEHDKRTIAYNASFSLLDDFLKGLIIIVEMGVFSFEEIFVSYFTDKQGHRLGEILTKKLPDFISGRLALTEGTHE